MDEHHFNVTSYFYDSIELLRTKRDIIIHSSFVQISEDDEQYVTSFLENEFQKERCNFPGELPEFNANAAIWGAKTIFIAAQLLMLRDIPEKEFDLLLPMYSGEINESTVLSCDLCLRFLPEIIEQAQDIDTYDELIQRLEKLLSDWTYSAIGFRNSTFFNEEIDTNPYKSQAMRILLAERIVRRKSLHRIPESIKEIVKPYMGINE